jgi:hypothetical protein
LETFFGSLRCNRKEKPVSEIIKQLFCFYRHGTSRHLVHFDALARKACSADGTELEARNSLLGCPPIRIKGLTSCAQDQRRGFFRQGKTCLR